MNSSSPVTQQSNQGHLQSWTAYLSTLPWELGCLDDSSYRAALRGASLHVKAKLVLQTIGELIEQAGDTPKWSKINSQVQRAYAFVTRAPEASTRNQRAATSRPNQIPFRPEALARLASKITCANIESFISDRSPYRSDLIDSSGFLDRIYRPGEKVLIFLNYTSQGQAIWTHAFPPAKLPTGGVDGVWFLVNPVDGNAHPNPRQGGKPSRRSQEAITAFRFAVLESDHAEVDCWLRFLALAPFRIVAIYLSGGRSVHALVQIDAEGKDDWDRKIKPVKSMLTILGADPAALTAVRLSRLPQAMRGGNQQRLIYLNPGADGTPIFTMPIRPIHREWAQYVRAKMSWLAPLTPDEVHTALEELQPFAQDPDVGSVIAQLKSIEVSA